MLAASLRTGLPGKAPVSGGPSCWNGDRRGRRLVSDGTTHEAARAVRDRPEDAGIAEQFDLGDVGAHGGPVAVRVGIAAGDAGPPSRQVAHDGSDVLAGHR